jgi:hypothetical protein
MSAYIVEDRTINQIVTHLLHRRDCEWLRQLPDRVVGAKFVRRFRPELVVERAELLRLALSVPHFDGGDVHLEKCAAKLGTAGRGRLDRIRELLLYQCDEGDIAKDRLYGLLDDLKAVVADSIIERVTEPSRGWTGATGVGHEGDAYVAALLDELDNSLQARCEACCKGREHDDEHCGAPTARRLLAGAGKVRG